MELQFFYEKFIQNAQFAKYLLQIYNIDSFAFQLSRAQKLQFFIFCYFLLQNSYYKDSFFVPKIYKEKR